MVYKLLYSHSPQVIQVPIIRLLAQVVWSGSCQFKQSMVNSKEQLAKIHNKFKLFFYFILMFVDSHILLRGLKQFQSMSKIHVKFYKHFVLEKINHSNIIIDPACNLKNALFIQLSCTCFYSIVRIVYSPYVIL